MNKYAPVLITDATAASTQASRGAANSRLSGQDDVWLEAWKDCSVSQDHLLQADNVHL